MPSDGFAIGMALLWGAKEIPKQPRHISNGISRGIPHNPPQTKNASWIEKSQQCGSTEDGLWKKIRKRAHDFIHSEWREATRERMSQIETRSNDVFGIINDAKRWYDCSAKGRFFGEKQLPFRINRFTLNGHFLSIGQQLRHKYEQEHKKIARKFRYMSSMLNRLLAFAQQFSADSIEKKMVRCFATLCQLMRYKNTIKRDEMTEEHFRGEKSSIWLFLLVHASTELHRERVRVPRQGVGIYPNYISYYLFLFHLIA